MIKNRFLNLITVALATVCIFFASCEDEVSGIGNSISSSEVTINVDSISFSLNAKTVEAPSFESRSAYSLIGKISVPEYGDLSCSYVTQFLPASTLNLPDTITWENIDSVKMIMSVPKTYITGDTVTPQQLKVFSLTKQLPSNISADFNPDGYYNPGNPLSVKNYTLSGYSFNDTTFTRTQTLQIKSELPLELGRKTVKAYSENPDIFIWPETFAEYWPGIYVEPSFGKGGLAPVQNTSIYAYFPQTKIVNEKDENGESKVVYKQVADSVCMFSTAPEVISNVNINYTPSSNILGLIEEGKSIMTTPGGYTVSFEFPAKEILRKYWEEEYDLGVINNMIFSIPAKAINNSYGLGIPPALLLIKTSEMEDFFSEGKMPDNINSFTSAYSPEDNCYTFSSMRQYIVNLKEKGEENITEEDVSFTLLPVTISTEDYTDNSTGKVITVVVSITPYIIMPTMTEFDTDNATIVFTFSNQTLY